jgi:hypothetical protein
MPVQTPTVVPRDGLSGASVPARETVATPTVSAMPISVPGLSRHLILAAIGNPFALDFANLISELRRAVRRQNDQLQLDIGVDDLSSWLGS